ncbi:MAG: Gfo/Idh/MocA family oxidoreductase [Phycisphaerae bacterium]|nr:Gfo/Idh/MocA family oxidoreductase [Phycisphaerae bacterium]MDW8261577.1 Gfo/Idh/MocA family oxidoreductase [Phycisphaerales bacterium]
MNTDRGNIHVNNAPEKLTNGKRVKVALVGISGYGDSYLDSLLHDRRAAAVEIVGLADPAPQRCRRLAELSARRIPIYPSLTALLNERTVELVLICSPIHFHAPQTVQAVEHGAAVLCEKPLAGSLRDARRIVAAHDASRWFVAVGYQWSFSAAVQALKDDVLRGNLGKPRRLKSLVSFPRGLTYFNRNDWAGRIKTPRGDDVLDSPVNNATAHYLHNMLYVLGKTRDSAANPVSVQAELYRANDIENYDTAALRVFTDCGAEILFYTTHAMADRIGPLALYEFENATVEYNADASGAFVARFNDGTVKNYGNPNVDRNEKIWQSVAATRGGQTVACHARTALPHTLCAVTAQQSPGGITVFPAHLRSRIEAGDDSMIVIRGLDLALHDCFERDLLPSELGSLPWARASAAVEVPAEPQPAVVERPEAQIPT